MSDRPPELDDQNTVRSSMRIGGGILVAIGGILAIAGFADFVSSFNSVSLDHPGEGHQPTHFWLLFIGFPMIAIGIWMLKAGFLGAGTRYVAGEVMPTVKDSLDYVGIGPHEAKCAKCGATNSADAKFCDHCGSALSVNCPSCGHANAAGSAFCSECGKPLTA